jgi:hypothetical protein
MRLLILLSRDKKLVERLKKKVMGGTEKVPKRQRSIMEKTKELMKAKHL